MKSVPSGVSFRFWRLLFAVALLGYPPLFLGQTLSQASFDAPGAGTGVYQGTFPAGINAKSVIAGYYADSSNVRHGFLRQPDGTFTEFSPPDLLGIVVVAINDHNQTLGWGTLSEPYARVGFLRYASGDCIWFAPAGALSTTANGLNNKGEVAGDYEDTAYVYHGWLRDAHGNITALDDPDADVSSGHGTFARAINDNGEIAGYYDDLKTGGVRAFVRDQFGNFTNFDAVAGGSAGVVPISINSSGEIAGQYFGTNFAAHGFVRDASGRVTDFDPPGSQLTTIASMNDRGEIVGNWENSQFVTNGFERSAAGVIRIISVPDLNQTSFAGMNNTGTMTGSWVDLDFVSHGFVK